MNIINRNINWTCNIIWSIENLTCTYVFKNLYKLHIVETYILYVLIIEYQL